MMNAAANGNARANANGKNVLIVDDEPGVCLVLGDALSGRGFDCHGVSDGAEARELLETEPYDLLIADITMPEVSGLDLLVFARKHAPACKVVLTTGLSCREYLAQALMLGAYDYVEKPFDVDDLIQTARRATGGEAEAPRLPMRAAAAMELSSRAEGAALDSVRALARAVEAKDPYTRRHSDHVAHYAVSLAGALGADQKTTQSVRTVALLHDVGKIGVPDRILTKPGRLTEDEFELMRGHPSMGADILANITLFGPEALAVRHHHENWDGSGYPDKLTGEEIPFAARIIRVADSMDAMLMARTYKDAYTIDRMLGELRCCAGRQYDPAIAAAGVTWACRYADKLITPNRPIEAIAS